MVPVPNEHAVKTIYITYPGDPSSGIAEQSLTLEAPEHFFTTGSVDPDDAREWVESIREKTAAAFAEMQDELPKVVFDYEVEAMEAVAG